MEHIIKELEAWFEKHFENNTPDLWPELHKTKDDLKAQISLMQPVGAAPVEPETPPVAA